MHWHGDSLTFLIFNYMYAYVSVDGYMRMSAGTQDPRRGHQIPELELQEVVNSPRWALGTELGSSEGVMCALNHSLQPLTFSLAHFGEFQERPS